MVNGSLSRVVLVRDAHPAEVVGIIRPAVGLPGGREPASMADSKESARPFDIQASHGGYISAPEAQVPSHRATASAASVPHRTLTGLRFAVVDESASFVDSGAL